MTTPFQRIRVIANPASGQPEPVLHTLNSVFHPHDIDWQMSVTHSKEDGALLTQKALDEGVVLIAVYGGDGSVSEVARVLAGTETPLAILPGGTANALAVGLGIGPDLRSAANQIFTSKVQALDMGEANGRYFILRADIGISTRLVEQASPELKARFGLLAYLVATVQSLGQMQSIDFTMELDGQTIETSGIACIVTNYYELGALGLKFSQDVQPDDGVMDVFVIRDLGEALNAVTAQIAQQELTLGHWQGQQIKIRTQNAEPVHLDGDRAGETPLDIQVLPQAVKVLIPEK